MKVLKNKTYNDLILQIRKAEDDIVKLSKKCDCKTLALDNAAIIQSKQLFEIKEKTDFISYLNERVQKAEAEAEEYYNRFNEQREDNRLLADERDELLSKLSRKGLGVKGKKKEKYFIGVDLAKDNSNFSHITEVHFEEQKYVEITSTEQLRKYNGCKFQADMRVNSIDSHVEGVVYNKEITTLILHNVERAGWCLTSSELEAYNTAYNYAWSFFDEDFGENIKYLKILL